MSGIVRLGLPQVGDKVFTVGAWHEIYAVSEAAQTVTFWTQTRKFTVPMEDVLQRPAHRGTQEGLYGQ